MWQESKRWNNGKLNSRLSAGLLKYLSELSINWLEELLMYLLGCNYLISGIYHRGIQRLSAHTNWLPICCCRKLSGPSGHSSISLIYCYHYDKVWRAFGCSGRWNAAISQPWNAAEIIRPSFGWFGWAFPWKSFCSLTDSIRKVKPNQR